jgi:hypothetical protein
MTVDASRSCLGLETCVGSAIRQIVFARVLLTAAAPPALPGSSVSGGSLAPPLAAITGFFRSTRRRRHAPGDGPDEAGQLTGDRGRDDIGRFAGAGELAIAAARVMDRLHLGKRDIDGLLGPEFMRALALSAGQPIPAPREPSPGIRASLLTQARFFQHERSCRSPRGDTQTLPLSAILASTFYPPGHCYA